MNFTTAMVQLPLVIREAEDSPKIVESEDVSVLCRDMKDLAQECFQVLTLNTKHKLISRNMITLGLVNASLVHPREIFRQAILDNAAAIILVHNHPSGDTTPSAEDIRITKQLIDAGRIVDIKVLDHIIIGDESSSMRTGGLCQF